MDTESDGVYCVGSGNLQQTSIDLCSPGKPMHTPSDYPASQQTGSKSGRGMPQAALQTGSLATGWQHP